MSTSKPEQSNSEPSGGAKVWPAKDKTTSSSISIRDLLQILIGPLVVAAFGIIVNQSIQTSQRDASDERARDAVLQTYMSSMDDLLIKQTINTNNQSAVMVVMATLRGESGSVLRELDGKRKFAVLQFLHDSGLISASHPLFPVTNSKGILEGADLSNIDLSGSSRETGVLLDDANLTGSILTGTNLKYANLSNSYLVNARLDNCQLSNIILNSAHLSGSNLTNTHLDSADLTNASLTNATLTNATLINANLTNANLSGAILTGANLQGADLTDVDLTGAVISQEQLNTAKSYSGAVMPDGTIHQ